MFTGIVEETGRILEVVDEPAGGRRIRFSTTFDDIRVGDSISVNGACLTAETVEDESLVVFCSQETLDRTYLGRLEVDDVVNLERALPADGRFDGHFVQGHVDATGEIIALQSLGEDHLLSVSLPASLEGYVVEKGSIAVDGISLTVTEIEAGRFETAIIPETVAITNLSAKAVGDPVHLEVDVIAKYVESITEAYHSAD